jgi:hypothetical protein
MTISGAPGAIELSRAGGAGAWIGTIEEQSLLAFSAPCSALSSAAVLSRAKRLSPERACHIGRKRDQLLSDAGLAWLVRRGGGIDRISHD